MRSFAGSDKGLVRRENEDSFLLHVPDDEEIIDSKGILAIVADGVGGGPAGKRASSMAVELIRDFYYQHPAEDKLEALRASMELANLRIYMEARGEPLLRGMATTCTALVACNTEGFLCHVGDSRAYLLRDGALHMISEDHTLVNELIAEGIISPEEGRMHPQRNIIMKALGSMNHLEPFTSNIYFQKGDTLLLCSDGLHGYMSDREISSILSRNTVEDAGRKLIELSLDRGGADNVTVLVLNI
ncbi:MAG: PP2C family protein-serine/threonine phosphatase [Dissulfurispiraceae bacterium]|jgi:PPM family protein phosphatase